MIRILHQILSSISRITAALARINSIFTYYYGQRITCQFALLMISSLSNCEVATNTLHPVGSHMIWIYANLLVVSAVLVKGFSAHTVGAGF